MRTDRHASLTKPQSSRGILFLVAGLVACLPALGSAATNPKGAVPREESAPPSVTADRPAPAALSGAPSGVLPDRRTPAGPFAPAADLVKGGAQALAAGGEAGVLIQPTIIATTTAPLFSSPVTNLVDQSGLSPAYGAGFTNCDAYAAVATHAASTASYYQFTPAAGGTIDFDLGSQTAVDAIVLWPVGNNGGAIQTISLEAADDPGFTSPTALGTFALAFTTAEPAPAQTFSFSSTPARYVRLTVVDNYGYPDASILGEVAFRGPVAGPTYDDRFGQQVAGTLDIHWECVSAPPGGSACTGIEFTDGTLADAADGVVTMAGVGTSTGLCIGLDTYEFTMAPDGLSLTGTAGGSVPMTLTRAPGDACFVGDWIASGYIFRAQIAADPFPVPEFDPSNVGDWSGWAAQAGIDFACALTIDDEVWDGSTWQVSGSFDWTCLFGAECSGTENVQGTISPAGAVHLQGVALVDPENLGLGTYDGQRSADGRTITGTWPGGGAWTVSRVSAYAVPAEATTIQNAVDLFADRPALRVEVAAGTYAENLDLAPLAASPGAVEITGPGLPDAVVLDDGTTAAAPPIVTTNGAAGQHPVILRNLTIAGGRIDADAGAGIRVNGGSSWFLVDNCVVRDNVADAGLNGGGLAVASGARARVEASSITANAAGVYGGGVSSAGTLVLKKTTVSANSAAGGGGVYATGPSTALRRCDVVGNQAGSDVGGVWLESTGSAVVDTCSFSDNVSPGWGGGLYFYRTAASVTRSTFTANQGEIGGGIAANGGNLAGCPLLSIRDCTLSGNVATATTGDAVGGGVYLQSQANVEILDSAFSGNTANVGGAVGALASLGVSAPALTIHGCRLEGNHAVGTAFGGAVYISVVGLDLVGSVFENNGSDGAGGALSMFASSGTIVDADFTGNAANDGGAASMQESFVDFVDCRFFDNESRGEVLPGSSPPYGGGALQATVFGTTGSTALLRVFNSTVVGNRSLGTDPSDGGGGIHLIGSAQLEVANSILWGNTAVGGSLEDQQVHLNSGSGSPTAALRYAIVDGLASPTTLGPGPLWGDDPLFVDQAAGDLHLTASSPAIDAGSIALLPAGVTTDLDGNARIANAGLDLGPYEHGGISGVDDGSGQEVPGPVRYGLDQNVPNPFNPETNIVFELPQARSVRLAVYTLEGRRVRTLVDGMRPAGEQRVVWNGLDDSGRPAASGVYLYRLEAGPFSGTRKMTLMK